MNVLVRTILPAGMLLLLGIPSAWAQILTCHFPRGDRAVEQDQFELAPGSFHYCQRIVLEPFRCNGPDFKILRQDGDGLVAVQPAGDQIAADMFVYDARSGTAHWARNIGTKGALLEQGICSLQEPEGLRFP